MVMNMISYCLFLVNIRSGVRYCFLVIAYLFLGVCASTQASSLEPIEFGKKSQKQWIINSSKTSGTVIRKNFGDITDKAFYGDYFGDNKVDLAVIRKVGEKLQWIVRTSRDYLLVKRVNFGAATDKPVKGDFNGDGKQDFAVVRKKDNKLYWYIDVNHDGQSDTVVHYGSASDNPIPADYNGDGKDDFAITRFNENELWWKVDTQRNGSTNISKHFGGKNDSPIQGDFNGDGKQDFAVTRKANGKLEWIIDLTRNGQSNLRKTFGLATDTPIIGDFNGDKKSDFAVIRHSNGVAKWFLDKNRDGSTDTQKTYGSIMDQPMTFDYDHDGKDDLVVSRNISYINGKGVSGLQEDVDHLVMKHLADNRIPGASVAIAKNGKLIHTKGYGFKDLEDKQPNSERSMFRVGSISKIITALSFMKLTEQKDSVSLESLVYGNNGLLKDPLYIQQIQSAVNNGKTNSPLNDYLTIKAKHYASHTAGFDDRPKGFVSLANNQWGVDHLDDLTYKQVHASFLAHTNKKNAVNSLRYNYENQNLGVLGFMVSENSGQSYKSYVQSKLLKPIGLEKKILALDHEFNRHYHETGYNAPSSVEYGKKHDQIIRGDFNGDSVDDLVLVRNASNAKEWLIDFNHDGVVDKSIKFGKPSDKVLEGDFNGDGRSDLAVIRKDGNQWRWYIDLKRNGQHDINKLYGLSSDTPWPADFNGDGKTDMAVMRNKNGKRHWLVDYQLDGSKDLDVHYGDWTDKPYKGDFNGDGKIDFVVARKVNQKVKWFMDFNHDGKTDRTTEYGAAHHTMYVEDYNGDGKSDIISRISKPVSKKPYKKFEWRMDYNTDGTTDFVTNYGNSLYKVVFGHYRGYSNKEIALIKSDNNQLVWKWKSLMSRQLITKKSNLGLAAGLWITSAGDFIRLLLASDQKINHPDVLKKSTLKLMETPIVPNQAIGWQYHESGQGYKVAHNGSLTGGYGRVEKFHKGYGLGDEAIKDDVFVAVFVNYQKGDNIRSLISEIVKKVSDKNIPSNIDYH